MTKNTGGPAFPSTLTDDTLHVPGMTLRDHFAGLAMQGSLAHGVSTTMTKEEFTQRLVKTSYQIADAMLAEREKGE